MLRRDIWDDWGEELNSIGNLMILERQINRSISNITNDKKIVQYKNSKYKMAQNQALQDEWNLKLCMERKEKEIAKLSNYLFTN